MSKKPRWPEPVNMKTNKPGQKRAGKDQVMLPVHSRGNSSCSTLIPSVAFGRSSSFSSRTDESGERGEYHSNGPPLNPSIPPPRLASSHSFSSLHNSSFPAAPFMRRSRSLSRQDHRHASDDSGSRAHLRRRHLLDNKFLNSGHLSSSDEQLRDKKGQSYDENAETSSMSGQSLSSPGAKRSSSKVKKQTKDGVYTLCSMTSGMKRNWVRAVLKNVRTSPTRDITSSPPKEHACCEPFSLQEHKISSCKEECPPPPETVEEIKQPSQVETSGPVSSEPASPLCSITSSLASPATPPTTYQPPLQENFQESPPLNKTSVEDVIIVRDTEIQVEGSSNLQSTNLLPEEEVAGDQLQLANCGCDCVEENDKLPFGRLHKEMDHSALKLSSDKTVHQLQKINHDLRCKLEAEKKINVEAREAELRRRVDLLAQQAQMLVTGDATALAQVQVETERQRFYDQRAQWEQRVNHSEAQLSISEQQRKESELLSGELKQEIQHNKEEMTELRGQLHDVMLKLQDNEKTKADKESRLQKHLMLLQASQERERISFFANLAKAEQTAVGLQERLDKAEQQVERLNQTQSLSKEIEDAQQELREELGCTVSAMQRLRSEKERVDAHCLDLQKQLSEAEEVVSKLQNRLKTDETQYYNLEHSYERVSEELQLALGKVHQREAETQEMRECYERLLDRKEQELSEVLLKMEVLGNTLEETEVKLNDALETKEDLEDDVTEVNADPSDQTAAGDDPQRFMAVIKFLESKLFITEEKLKDITQRLEEETSNTDPQLHSRLTQSRAAVQHLSLLLHSQTRQSQNFAQDIENQSRVLVGRFQVALNNLQACRENLPSSYNSTSFNVADFERQLADVVTCLMQGKKVAEKQQKQSIQAIRDEDRILQEMTTVATRNNLADSGVGWRLNTEKVIVEEILAVLQNGFGLQVLATQAGDVTQRYKSITSQLFALKESGVAGHDAPERAIRRVCTEAELVYATFKLQQQFDTQQEALNNKSPTKKSSEQDYGEADRTSSEEDPDCLKRILTGLRGRANLLETLGERLAADSRCDVSRNWEDMSDSWLLEEAKWIYLSNRLYVDFDTQLKRHKQQTASLTCELESLKKTVCDLHQNNQGLKDQLKQAQQNITPGETGNHILLEDLKEIQDNQEQRTKTLEMEFQKKIQKLQQIHEEEMKHLLKCCMSKERSDNYCKEGLTESDSFSSPELRDVGLQDIRKLEKMHRYLMSDLQQQHQMQVEALQREKEQLLQEETSATMAAMVAMKRAHKEELQKSRCSQHILETKDLSQVQLEYEKRIQLLHQELELLSLQHTQKCLENSQLCQELQGQRNSLMQYQKENKEVKKNQREDNETAHCHVSVNGKHGGSQMNHYYEMEMILRAKEAEMKFLNQEAQSLRDDLKLARKDKIYAQNKLESFYLTNLVDAQQDSCEDSEDPTAWSDGRETYMSSSEETLTDANNKSPLGTKDKKALTQLIRGVSSKNLTKGLSPQERMHLFETEF